MTMEDGGYLKEAVAYGDHNFNEPNDSSQLQTFHRDQANIVQRSQEIGITSPTLLPTNLGVEIKNIKRQ